MTAWIEHLARLGATVGEAAPSVTPSVSFADAASEARAAEDATIAVPLLHLGTIRSQGPDSATFLHNLVSNDVKNMGADTAAWNSFNSPKGRMIASLLVWTEDGGHALALSADILPAFLKKFSMYVLRSKVKLADARAELALIGVAGPQAEAIVQAAGAALPTADMCHMLSAGGLRCIRLGAQRYVLAAATEAAPAVFDALLGAGAVRAGTAAWQLGMIRAGLPLITAATQEEFVAQMLNYELIGGVDFHKGCYPGQEIVARTQYLGKLKKRTYRLALPAGVAATAGTDLYAPDFGEQSAGKLVNLAPNADGSLEALAVIQSSSAEAGEIRVGAPDGPRATLLDLPYALG
ncbi:folate-binding protein [Thauera sp.]|jgi:folate-binding protein YgfZ|uniref:CAF17-like 4Fe-4S cluster assembly/insertion protein YgfZ n=1 Tax=Thauera sp. TaxID=1905334 RepID=UPI00260C2C30|nr:folate-binding protein [Thauera sp.]